jgi:hypothetical protein
MLFLPRLPNLVQQKQLVPLEGQTNRLAVILPRYDEPSLQFREQFLTLHSHKKSEQTLLLLLILFPFS